MAVYRQIKITYWQDKFVLRLTPEEKFFYLYLLTNSKTKQCGVYELPLKVVEMETGYNRETVIKLVQKFIEYDKIKFDWENEEIFMLNWLKHNPPKNPNVRRCVEEELCSVHNLEMIPEDSLLRDFLPEKIGGNSLQAVVQKEKEEEKEQKELREQLLDDTRTKWNNFANNHKLSPIVKLSDTRAKNVIARLKEPEFKIDTILDIISESSFLKGQNSNGWKVDFDFVFGSKTNYLKILEGKYSADKKSKEVEL